MDKPIILAINDIKTEIVSIINKSEIPAFFLLQILRDIENQLFPLTYEEIKIADEHYKISQENLNKEKGDD